MCQNVDNPTPWQIAKDAAEQTTLEATAPETDDEFLANHTVNRGVEGIPFKYLIIYLKQKRALSKLSMKQRDALRGMGFGAVQTEDKYGTVRVNVRGEAVPWAGPTPR